MKPRSITNISLAPGFDKRSHRLPPRIQLLAKRKTAWFQADAYDPQLKTHALSGQLDGFHAFSVNKEYRVLFQFKDKHSALFVNIGTHAVYR